MSILRQTIENLGQLDNVNQQAAWLLCNRLNCNMADLIIDNIKPTKDQEKQIEKDIEKLKNGYPLQYLLGETEFMGLKFIVKENVLIPRNDTEILVTKAVEYIKDKPLKVLDMCCGTGCIGISIASLCKNTKVTCADISSFAIELTKENAKLNNVDVQIIQSDLFENITEKYDVLVSNPPYIETNEMEKLPIQVQFEPKLALDGYEDGIYFYKKIVNECKEYLNNQNKIFFEIGYNQGKSVGDLLPKSEIIKDYHGKDRVIIGEKN